jgi:transposase
MAGRNRRLSKDYEMLPCSSEAFVYLAMIRLMLNGGEATWHFSVLIKL